MEGVLEGLLYVSGDDGISISQVMSILELNEEEAKKLVYSLKKKYEEEDRGLRINYLGNTFKLTTKEEHRKYYESLISDKDSGVLSNIALETLAIIAYNQPITRNEIDDLRGVDSIFIIRKLVAKGLIKEAGRTDNAGRAILYKTTDDFLDYFGLSSIDDLPSIEFEESKESDEKDLFKSNYHEIEEVNDEAKER